MTLKQMGIFIKHPMVCIETVDLCLSHLKGGGKGQTQMKSWEASPEVPRLGMHTQHLDNISRYNHKQIMLLSMVIMIDAFFLMYHRVLGIVVLSLCLLNTLGLMGSIDRRLRLQ